MSIKVRLNRGYLLIELLVSLAILLYALGSTATLLQGLVHATASNRTFSKVVAHTNSLVGVLKNQSFISTLKLIDSVPINIVNNQEKVLSASDLSTLLPASTSDSADGRATFQVKLRARRASGDTIPSAVSVLVSISQKRGIFGTSDFTYETILSRAAHL
jgi:type II secretory pathway pseudopilin PulG